MISFRKRRSLLLFHNTNWSTETTFPLLGEKSFGMVTLYEENVCCFAAYRYLQLLIICRLDWNVLLLKFFPLTKSNRIFRLWFFLKMILQIFIRAIGFVFRANFSFNVPLPGVCVWLKLKPQHNWFRLYSCGFLSVSACDFLEPKSLHWQKIPKN